MALTIEILNSISKHIEASSEGSGLVLSYIYSEMYRLQHGPFTLAEARASGKPFGRKGSSDDRWFEGIASEAGCLYFTAWMPDPFGGEPYVGLEQAVGLDDIDAVDYELRPEGGE